MNLVDIVRRIEDSKIETLEGRVWKYIGRIEKRFPSKPEEYMRVSHVTRLCPREETWYSLKGITREEEINAGKRITWDFGITFQNWVRDRYLGPMGELVGKWECMRCSENKRGTMPTSCVCGKGNWQYVEDEIKNDEYLINGHADGFLKLRSGDEVVLEIKTANDSSYKDVEKRRFEAACMNTYLKQINLYMWLAKMDKGLFLFFNKNTSAVMTLAVERDDGVIGHLLDMVKEFRNGVKAGILPPCRCWDVRHDKLSLEGGVA